MLKELREKRYITNFRGYPSKGSNMYQLKHSKVGLLKIKPNRTKLASLHDSIDSVTTSVVTCKTMNESMKETMNIISDESELYEDSLSEKKVVKDYDDTEEEALEVIDNSNKSVTHERLLELIPVLREDKKN